MARARGRRNGADNEGSGHGEGEPTRLANSGARADTIRAAVAYIADREAEIKAIRADVTEYKQKHIKGDLGFKLSDWAAIYRVSQLDTEDRDQLLDTIKEGFAALGIGQSVDWVAAAEASQPYGAGASE